jgi:arylformamidase
MTLYDISPLISEAIAVWPGDAGFARSLTFRIAAGASVNVSAISLSTHTGSHVDAPYHFAEQGRTVDQLPLEPFIGPATLVSAEGARIVGPEHLAGVLDGEPIERLIVRTRRGGDPNRFDPGFAALAPEAARRLVELGVRLYATDAYSVDSFDSKTLETHKILAAGRVMILEALRLDEPPPGAYELIALPLRIAGADASPVRAVLRPLPSPRGAQGR